MYTLHPMSSLSSYWWRDYTGMTTKYDGWGGGSSLQMVMRMNSRYPWMFLKFHYGHHVISHSTCEGASGLGPRDGIFQNPHLRDFLVTTTRYFPALYSWKYGNFRSGQASCRSAGPEVRAIDPAPNCVHWEVGSRFATLDRLTSRSGSALPSITHPAAV